MYRQSREPEVLYSGEDYLVVQGFSSDEATRELPRKRAISWEEAISRGVRPDETVLPPRRPNLGRGAALMQCLIQTGMGPLVGASNAPNSTENNVNRPDVLAPELIVSPPGISEHNGLGRATRRGGSEIVIKSEISTSYPCEPMEESNMSEGAACGIDEGFALDRLEGRAFDKPEAEVPSTKPSVKSEREPESALALPEEEQDMSISDETNVSCPTPSGPEVEEVLRRRLLEDRRAFIAANGVPRVVLILCSLFWKLEILKICELLFGPEAPPNDDRFCRQVAEKMYQHCCRPGEKLAAESRVTIHAIDVVEQTQDQIVHSVEQYGRSYTHVLIIPNTYHFWDLLEQDLGGNAPGYMNEVTHRYVNLGTRLMRQGMAREVLLLPFLPMGNPTCGLIPRAIFTGVWDQLVDSCNHNNEYIDIILKHMWTRELAQGTMNVPNSVAWNYIPLDTHLSWSIYINHFTDRYEKRRPITLPCGSTHRSGSHYLLHELWGLVQDTVATCMCEMTVKILRPVRKRGRKRRS